MAHIALRWQCCSYWSSAAISGAAPWIGYSVETAGWCSVLFLFHLKWQQLLVASSYKQYGFTLVFAHLCCAAAGEQLQLHW
jgi:hypothetical protein